MNGLRTFTPWVLIVVHNMATSLGELPWLLLARCVLSRRAMSSGFPLMIFGALALSACSSRSTFMGTDGGQQGLAGRGQTCTCQPGENCCEDGLICDNCETTAGGGLVCSGQSCTNDADGRSQCTQEPGTCRAPRSVGTICELSAHCGEGAECLPSKLPGETRRVCTRSSGLPADRCEVDLDCDNGNVCANSYCKKGQGVQCYANSECASNRCYGSVTYYCQ